MLAVVAKGLRGLKEKVASVGGATIDLYVTYPADAVSRPTDDVDCVVELASRGQYYGIEEELRSLGFKNSLGKGPICRWEYCGIMVDVMPTEGKILGFSNRWYPAGLASAVEVSIIDNNPNINVAVAKGRMSDAELAAFLTGRTYLSDYDGNIEGHPRRFTRVVRFEPG